VAGIAADIPPVEVDGPADAELLVLGWGSTYGAIQASIRRVRAQGHRVAHAHLRHLNPFPTNLGGVIRAYPKVLVPEMNFGQLLKLVRAEFLVDARGLNKMQGKPFRAEEIEQAIYTLLLDRP
jgi:2-oxoglutarate ferredoxin oxidoreductase subunit alpha